MSQRELGRRLGVHHNFVSSCEMGDRALNFVEVRQWCRALGLSWVEFTRAVDDLLISERLSPEALGLEALGSEASTQSDEGPPQSNSVG